MRLRHLLTAIVAFALMAVLASTASAASYVPGRVIVAYRAGTSHSLRLRSEIVAAAHFDSALPGGPRVLRLGRGASVAATAARLRREPEVAYAVPDYRLRAADFIPDDPGLGGYAGWERLQWNFLAPWGVNAPQAWDEARAAGAPGGHGVTVAVIDSGVAFESYRRFRRAPDLAGDDFVAGYDFLTHSHHPEDQYGHGTHVTGTIAERTNNGFGLTGLAYEARIMPLRVLDASGGGDGATIAVAIRYAVRHGARVINMSVEFDPSLSAADIPEVISAMDYAASHRVVMVAAAGNEGGEPISYPARDPNVISVGATTADGCLADYSNFGRGLSLVAPGGGSDAALSGDPSDRANCHPDRPGRAIYQETFASSFQRFGLVGMKGTSFATPHVTAAAAMLLATGRLGTDPTPREVAARLEETARPLGSGRGDPHYGAGLLDIGAALGP